MCRVDGGNGALKMEGKTNHTNKGTCAQFLRDNPRFLNEPIRYLLPGEKSTSVAECLEWIKDKDEDRPTIRPSLQSNSNQVKIAQPVVSPSKRHVHREAASGIAPGIITDSKQPFVEKISFRHAYDSRANPSEPIRGKLHGNFVWQKRNETLPLLVNTSLTLPPANQQH